jgi:threonine dehydrogenase-like Zn-dependent dehydrogenase
MPRGGSKPGERRGGRAKGTPNKPAAGGVGLTAVEIGKARGARVIAAAGGADKLAVARSRGADELIDYRSESLRDAPTASLSPASRRAR